MWLVYKYVMWFLAWKKKMNANFIKISTANFWFQSNRFERNSENMSAAQRSFSPLDNHQTKAMVSVPPQCDLEENSTDLLRVHIWGVSLYFPLGAAVFSYTQNSCNISHVYFVL